MKIFLFTAFFILMIGCSKAPYVKPYTAPLAPNVDNRMKHYDEPALMPDTLGAPSPHSGLPY
ncbi:MAG: hypothetical protein ACNA7Y_03625 [Gammaproteobacteria bacterium]